MNKNFPGIIKIFKLSFIYAVVFLLIFLIFDISFFYYINYTQKSVVKSQKLIQNDSDEKIKNISYFIKLNKFSSEYPSIVENGFRPVMNPESNMRPNIIFGCSYAFGYVFDDEETISYIMSKYSERPIYNRAYSGWGIQHMIYQLKNDNNFVKSIKAPKYIFYVLMDNSGHFERLRYTSFPSILNDIYYFTYKVNDGKFIENTPLFNLYYGFALPRHIQNRLIQKEVLKELDYSEPEIFNLFISHFVEADKLIKQHFGEDTKFVILTFEGTFKQYWKKQLNDIGIDVVDIADTINKHDLQNPEYEFFKPEIAGHPVGKLWEELMPKLKELYPDM